MSRLPVTIALVLALALAALGCGTSKESSSSSSASTTVSASHCTPAKLETHSKGQLTVATDKPAYPPYFVNDDPTNEKGFESAVGYAIGKQLGYPAAKVQWTVEPFDSSYAPGPKQFDFDVNEISITPVREKAVDFSAPYYTRRPGGGRAEGLRRREGEISGGPEGREDRRPDQHDQPHAVEDEIEPSSRPEVFNNSGDVVTALKNGQVEAVVVDLPDGAYLTAAQVKRPSSASSAPPPAKNGARC